METDKQGIKVAVRIRPFSPQEIQEKQQSYLEFLNFKSLAVSNKQNQKHNFYFDFVGNEYTNQEQIFEQLAKPLCLSCLQGYNGSIFAYGQTGAGKTYTISGNDEAEDNGLLPRSIEFLFQQIQQKQRNPNLQFKVKCSFLEIYNEQILDLLNPSSGCLMVREDQQKGIYVENLKECTVNNFFEAQKLFRLGNDNRHVAETNMNLESSRSHSVFTLIIKSLQQDRGITQKRQSLFNFVDLAGSERHNLTDNQQRFKEGCNINKSLHVLGSVMNAQVDIQEGRQRHVHYRDSKLTLILKDSLGGNSKTVICACVGPSLSQQQETLSTLKFAKRAKFVKSVVRINEEFSGDNEALKNEIKRLRQQHENKDSLTLDVKLREHFLFYQEMFQEFQIKNLDSLEKCEKVLGLFQQKEIQYKLIIDLLQQRIKRSGDQTVNSDQQITNLIKEHPVALQFQEEIFDLRNILSLKIKQQKEDDLIEKSQKYINELNEIFQKIDINQETQEKLMVLQDVQLKKDDQIQLLTLENIQLDDKIQQINIDQQIKVNKHHEEQIQKMKEQIIQYQEQIQKFTLNNTQLQQKNLQQQEKIDKLLKENQDRNLQNQTLNQDIEDFENQIYQLSDEKNQKFEENLFLKQNQQTLELQIKRQYEEKKQFEDQMEKEMQSIEDILQKQKTQNQNLQETNNNQKLEIQKSNDDKNLLNKQIQQKQDQLKHYEQDIQNLQQCNKENICKLDNIYEKFEKEQEKNINFQNDILQQQKKYVSNIEEKEFLIQQMTKQLHGVLMEQARVTQEKLEKFDEVQKQLDQYQSTQNNLLMEKNSLQEEILQKNLEIQQIRIIITNNISEIQKYKEITESLLSQNTILNQQLKQEKDIYEIKDQQKQINEITILLQESLDKVKNLENIIQQLKNQINDYENQINEKNDKILQLKEINTNNLSQLDILEKNGQSLQNQIKVQKEQQCILQQEIHNQENVCKQLKFENNQKQQKIELQSSELAYYQDQVQNIKSDYQNNMKYVQDQIRQNDQSMSQKFQLQQEEYQRLEHDYLNKLKFSNDQNQKLEQDYINKFKFQHGEINKQADQIINYQNQLSLVQNQINQIVTILRDSSIKKSPQKLKNSDQYQKRESLLEIKENVEQFLHKEKENMIKILDLDQYIQSLENNIEILQKHNEEQANLINIYYKIKQPDQEETIRYQESQIKQKDELIELQKENLGVLNMTNQKLQNELSNNKESQFIRQEYQQLEHEHKKLLHQLSVFQKQKNEEKSQYSSLMKTRNYSQSTFNNQNNIQNNNQNNNQSIIQTNNQNSERLQNIQPFELKESSEDLRKTIETLSQNIDMKDLLIKNLKDENKEYYQNKSLVDKEFIRVKKELNYISQGKSQLKKNSNNIN